MELDWEKQVMEFNQVWENRYQTPIVTENWVENEWANGRTEYLTFLIKVKDKSVIKRVKEIQSELGGFQCIELFPEEYFHLTVKGIGFLVAEKTVEDELSQDALSRFIREARIRLNKFSPFELKLENLNNFVSAICVQAHDGGLFRNMNRAMLEIPGIHKQRYDYPYFLPHLSIAQYKSNVDYSEFIKHLELKRNTKLGPLKIDRVQLIIAHLPINGRFPDLDTIEEFNL